MLTLVFTHFSLLASNNIPPSYYLSHQTSNEIYVLLSSSFQKSIASASPSNLTPIMGSSG